MSTQEAIVKIVEDIGEIICGLGLLLFSITITLGRLPWQKKDKDDDE